MLYSSLPKAQLVPFFDNYISGNGVVTDWLHSHATDSDLLSVVYNGDRNAFLDAYVGQVSLVGLSGMLTHIGGSLGGNVFQTAEPSIPFAINYGALSPDYHYPKVSMPDPQNIGSDTLMLRVVIKNKR